jgi:hypothetical protein
VPSYGYTVTEHDPAKPWLIFGREHCTIDLEAILAAGVDPNEALLHECAHAWQWFVTNTPTPGRRYQRERWQAITRAERYGFGYGDAPHEAQAGSWPR